MSVNALEAVIILIFFARFLFFENLNKGSIESKKIFVEF